MSGSVDYSVNKLSSFLPLQLFHPLEHYFYHFIGKLLIILAFKQSSNLQSKMRDEFQF